MSAKLPPIKPSDQAAHNYDLIVVGAGLIGATFASLAAQSLPNQRVAIIDRASMLSYPEVSNQRVVALGHLATSLLECVGVFEGLDAARCFAYKRMFVWDERSTGELEFNATDAGAKTEHLGHMVDSIYCNYVLQQKLLEHDNLDCYFDTQITHLLGNSSRCERATLRTAEYDLSSPLIVAADGSNSWLRRLAKISSSSHSYEQLGIVAKIHSSLAHQDTAWQRFLRDGPLGVLPLADNYCSIVWSAKDERAQYLLALDDDEFCLELAETLEHQLGEVSLASPRQAFPLRSCAAERYFSGRVVLLGDAAHSIHPLAGQGANLGFKDIQCLIGSLCDEASDTATEVTSLLADYEQRRKQDNVATDQAMSLLNSAFLNSNPVWASVRGLGMTWVSNRQDLKQLLTRQAIGS